MRGIPDYRPGGLAGPLAGKAVSKLRAAAGTGCGKGRFTCETAAAEPDVLFVAVERVPDAMVIAMERAKAVGLANVFFIDADVARLRDYFSPDEVERIYINFLRTLAYQPSRQTSPHPSRFSGALPPCPP